MICIDLYDWEEGSECSNCARIGSRVAAELRYPDFGPVCGHCFGSILKLKLVSVPPVDRRKKNPPRYLSHDEITAGFRTLRETLEAMP